MLVRFGKLDYVRLVISRSVKRFLLDGGDCPLHDGWLLLRWWVTILGMVGYHPVLVAYRPGDGG